MSKTTTTERTVTTVTTDTLVTTTVEKTFYDQDAAGDGEAPFTPEHEVEHDEVEAEEPDTDDSHDDDGNQTTPADPAAPDATRGQQTLAVTVRSRSAFANLTPADVEGAVRYESRVSVMSAGGSGREVTARLAVAAADEDEARTLVQRLADNRGVEVTFA